MEGYGKNPRLPNAKLLFIKGFHSYTY
jgi:hypothetical protein